MAENAQEMARMRADIEAFVTAAAINFAQGVVTLNNEGGDGAPPAPIDTGELRGSVRVTVNEPSRETSGDPPYPLVRPGDVARAVQLGGFAMGDALVLTWIADHAAIIEGERRMGSHGRMLGSEQAPTGWIGHAVDVQMSRQDRWRYRGRATP